MRGVLSFHFLFEKTFSWEGDWVDPVTYQKILILLQQHTRIVCGVFGSVVCVGVCSVPIMCLSVY